MSDSVLSKNKRHYPSLWGASRKLGRINLIDLAGLPHSKNLLQVFQEAVVLLQLLTMMSSKLEPLRGSNSRIHRYVYASLLDKFSVTSFDKDPAQAIPWLLLITVFGLVKIAAIVLVFKKSLLWNLEKGQFLTKSLKYLTNVLYLRLTLFFIPHTVVCVSVFRQQITYLYFLSIILLLMTPLELLLHHVLTFDYRFFRINVLQGKNYSMFLLKNSLIFTITIFESLFRSEPERTWANPLLLAMHFLIGSTLFWFLSKNEVYHGSLRYLGNIFSIFYLIYSIEAVFLLFHHTVPDSLAGYDLDLLLVIWVCILFYLKTKLSQMQTHKLLYSKFDASKTNPTFAKKYMEFLIELYENHRESIKKKNELLLNLTLHTQTCCNPLCLCFKLKLFYQRDVGPRYSTCANNIHCNYHGADSIENNFFSTFSDKDLLADIKQETESFIKVSVNSSKKQTELTLMSIKDTRPSTLDCKIDLSSRIAFQQFACSLYTCCFESGNFFDLFVLATSFCSFLIYEYSNPLAALMFCYNYAYSVRYKRYSSFLRHVYLHNFIEIAKNRFSDDSLSKASDKAGSTIKISDVVSFKIRIDELKERVKRLILEKADFYALIFDSQIDFKELISRSNTLYAGIKQTEKDIAPLLQAKSDNLRLMKTTLDLEIKLKERQKVSMFIRNSFKEALHISKNKISFNVNLLSKNRFNPLSSENSVALARKEQGTFRIAYFTNSCLELFGMPRHGNGVELTGKKIVEFMPSAIAPVHDKMIINYLNGNSSYRFGGRFNTSVLGKDGIPRSVFIFPKIECRFTDEVLVGAIISPRKKNTLPLLLTDEPGKILGTNRLFQGVLPRGCQIGEFGLFTMFPRLYEIYHCESWDTYRRKKHGQHSDQLDDELFDSSQQERVSKIEPNLVRTSVKNGSLDLLAFPMLCTGIITKLPQSKRTLEVQSNKFKSRSNFNWKRLRSVLLSENSSHFTVKSLTKYFLHHKKDLSSEMKKLLKTRINVETHKYQHGIVLREVTVEYYVPSEKYVQQFMSTNIKKHGFSIFEILTLKPESITDLFSLAALLRSVVQFTGRGETPQDLLKRIVIRMMEALDGNSRTEKKKNNKQQTKTSLAIQAERNEAKNKKIQGVRAFETLVDDITVEPLAAGSVRSNFFQPSSSKMGNNIGPAVSKPKNQTNRSEQEGEHSGSNQNYESSGWLQRQTGFYKFHMDIFDGNNFDESLHKLSGKIFEILGYLSEDLRGTQIAFMGELAVDLLLRSEDRSNKKSARRIAKNLGSTRNMIAGLSKMEIPSDSRVESISKDRTKTKSHVSRSKSDSYYADKEESLGEENNSDFYLNSELDKGTNLNSNGSVRHHQATAQHEAEYVRYIIENNRTSFKHFWWEVSLVLVTAILLGGKLLCKGIFNAKYTSVAVHGELANKYSRMLRPLGFVYKESVKCAAYMSMKKEDTGPGFLGGFFEKAHIGEMKNRMKGDLRQIFDSIESTREISFSLYPVTTTDTSNRMAYYSLCIHLQFLFDRFIEELETQTLTRTNKICDQMEELSVNMLFQFVKIYEEILEIEKKNLNALRSFFIIVCVFNFVSILPFALLVSLTSDAVHSQIKFEASLLVLIEKSKIDQAMKKLSGSRIKKAFGRKETAKQSTKAGSQIEASQVAIGIAKGSRRQVLHTIQLNAVDPFKKMPIRAPVSKKEQASAAVLNQHALGLKKPINSRILNLPQRSIFGRVIWAFGIFFVLGLPITIDILVQFKLIIESYESFEGLSDGNRIGSSILILTATEYKLNQAGSHQISPIALQLDKKMNSFLHLLPLMGNQPLEKSFKHIQLCEAVKRDFDSSQVALCDGFLASSHDQTIFTVLNEFAFQSDAARRLLDKGERIKSDLQYFLQPEFKRNDDLSLFLSLTIKKLCLEFKETLMTFVATAVNRSKAMNYVDIAVWCIFLLGCKLFMLRKSEKALINLRKTFLLINDDLLTTMYLKSYFMRGGT